MRKQSKRKNLNELFDVGEGKRSGPHSLSRTVIPHPSCQLPSSGGEGRAGPSAVSILPPELLDATQSVETAAERKSLASPDESSKSIHKVSRKRRSQLEVLLSSDGSVGVDDPHSPSPVSTRLRSRIGGQNTCGLESCGLESCGSCRTTPTPTPTSTTTTNNNNESIPPESSCCVMDDSNGNHLTSPPPPHCLDEVDAADGELEKRKRFGSDILLALADKISGRKKGGKKAVLHTSDLGFLNQLNSSLLISQTKPLKNGLKKVRSRLNPHKRKRVAPLEQRKRLKLEQTIKQEEASPTCKTKKEPSTSRPSSALSNGYRPPSTSEFKSKHTTKWSNGWSWQGESYEATVHLRNDEAPSVRKCYPAMSHAQGDVVRMRDCILLKSGTRPKDLPFVAKVSALWENADDGEMMMSLLWYYRPEHTEAGRRPPDLDDEIFASKHRDVCSVACIEDKCYVLTFNEYCRYRKEVKLTEQGWSHSTRALVPLDDAAEYPRRLRLPPVAMAPDRVFLCRKVYDFRQKRILKNPN